MRTRLDEKERERAFKILLDAIEKRGLNSQRQLGELINKNQSTISHYLEEMESRGLIKRENGRIVKTEAQRQAQEYKALNKDGFLEIPEVAAWYSKMEGQVKRRDDMVRFLQIVCDTLKVHPTAFLVDLTTSDELFHTFETRYREVRGQISLRDKSSAVRNFMLRSGISIPDSGTQYLSGEKENFGSYGDVYLTDKQIDRAWDYLLAKYGSTSALIFRLGVEIFARPATLVQLRGSQVRFENQDGCSFATFEVFEGKTGKKFPKFVFDPIVLAALRKAVSSNQGYLFSEGKEMNPAVIKNPNEFYAPQIREAYGAIGIDVTTHKFDKLINYYKHRPIYVLRHTGAWLWRRRGAPLEKIVAMGWDDPGTFTKCYAHLDASDLLEVGTCYYCQPPRTIDPEANAVFCKPMHALLYMNGHRITVSGLATVAS